MRIRIVADGLETPALRAALAAFARERRRIEQPAPGDEFCQVGNDGLYFKLITPPMKPESIAVIVDTLTGTAQPKVVKIN